LSKKYFSKTYLIDEWDIWSEPTKKENETGENLIKNIDLSPGLLTQK